MDERDSLPKSKSNQIIVALMDETVHIDCHCVPIVCRLVLLAVYVVHKLLTIKTLSDAYLMETQHTYNIAVASSSSLDKLGKMIIKCFSMCDIPSCIFWSRDVLVVKI